MNDTWVDAILNPPELWSTVLGYSAHMGYDVVLYRGINRWQDANENPVSISHWQALPPEPK